MKLETVQRRCAPAGTRLKMIHQRKNLCEGALCKGNDENILSIRKICLPSRWKRSLEVRRLASGESIWRSFKKLHAELAFSSYGDPLRHYYSLFRYSFLSLPSFSGGRKILSTLSRSLRVFRSVRVRDRRFLTEVFMRKRDQQLKFVRHSLVENVNF